MEEGKTRINSFTDLDVYKRSFNAATKAQFLVTFLRQNKEFGLADQLSRSTKAVPALIAEGYAKRYQRKHLQKYLDDAIGEANESIVHVGLTANLPGADGQLCKFLTDEYEIIGKQLYRFGESWSRSKRTG